MRQKCEKIKQSDYEQLLDEVFVISGIITVEVSVIIRSRRLRLITLTETSIIPDITKTESNNYFIIHSLFFRHPFFALPHRKISTLALIPFFVVWLLDVFLFKVFVEQFLRHFC